MHRSFNRLAKALRGGQRGFTLIELLIVVAILGILAAVIIPNVSTFMNTGKLNAARTEAENVKTAALAYYADHGGLPGATNGGWPTTQADLVSGNYTSNTPDGLYGWTTEGLISGTDASYSGLFHWDETNLTWAK